jgi:hypothetical protein
MRSVKAVLRRWLNPLSRACGTIRAPEPLPTDGVRTSPRPEDLLLALAPLMLRTPAARTQRKSC